jgi:hypothetical protein
MKKVYYKTDSQSFTNAYKFWEHINTSDESFHFYLYDEEFDKADWTTEPTESFDDLCSKRAKMIREKYDYVRIWYSAGRDSHHILTTFLKNNLRVDELIIMDWSIMKRFESDAIIAYETALKTFSEYNQSLPMISVLKPTKDDFDQYFCKDWYFKYGGYGCNMNFNLNHYPSIIEANIQGLGLRKNHCEVFGFEKCKIHYENGFYFQMNDKNFNQGLGNADNLEWFYLTGDMPELAIKQCHLLVNYMEDKQISNIYTIKSFQENSVNYDQFANVLNRGPMISNQTGGGVNKTFGLYPNLYKEIWNIAFTENWEAKTNYLEMLTTFSIQHKYWQEENKSFAGVPTKRYYLT